MSYLKKLFITTIALGFSSGAIAQSAATNNANQSTVCSSQGVGCQLSTNAKGNLYIASGTSASDLGKHEDSVAGNGDTAVPVMGKILAIPASQAGDGDYSVPLLNDLSAVYVDQVRRNAVTSTQPTVATATSTTCLAANTSRRYFMIQNNTAANIMISLSGATLTGIVPSATNIGIVLAAGANYQSPPNYVPTGAITCYQTSGGSVNTISVMEGQ